MKVAEATAAPVVPSFDRWRRVVVSGEDDRLVISIDRVVVARVAEVEPVLGYIAFSVRRGKGLEIRDIAAVRFPWAGEPFAAGVSATLSDEGMSPPELVEEVRPIYSIEAMRRQLQGTVGLEAVVTETGSVGDVRVTKSLHVDLDESALAHVRRWRFKPATLDGRAIPVTVRVEIDFRLGER
jgi:TonB family protein